MIHVLQLHGSQLYPKTTSLDPGDSALAYTEWVLHSGKVDKEGQFHAERD
jgi:hypothetical protein